MYFVKAGYRTVNLVHLVLLEDGADEPEPKAIPVGVVRATITTGRVLDFVGEAAEEMRRQVRQLAVTSAVVPKNDDDIPSHEAIMDDTPDPSLTPNVGPSEPI